MDIVDTFNHLIPTEHLDDALFLGSTLENEVCEDFSSSQNVLEDSLKNMLSDKDPMLGSASAQFCLPVLDSTDPNFQMPCSTVVGLDDIMDEGVKETARSTIDGDDFSPNKNLRDQMDGNSVKSPRKSPRLMTQEPVRSLRQSTLAKRSSPLPSATTKKPAVKPGPAQKAGLKQQDRGLSRPEDSSALEHPKEVGHPTKEPCQEEEASEVSSESVSSEWAPCCAESEQVIMESEHNIPSQAKMVEVPNEQENSSHLPGTSSPTKEPGSESEIVTKSECGSVGPEMATSSHADANPVQINPTEKKGNETVVDEISSEVTAEEQTDHNPEKETNKSVTDSEGDKIGTAEISHTATDYENASKTEETLAVQSSFLDGKSDCSSDLQGSGEIAHQISLPEEDKQESSDGSEKDKMKNDPVDSVELDQTDPKSTDAVSAKPITSMLEGVVQDIPVQVLQQQNNKEQMGEHETPGLQDGKPAGTSTKGTKKVKPKITKCKQNKAIPVQQKLASIHQEVHPGQSSVSLKRNAEQGNLQHFHKPVKVKKKHDSKDPKAQSCGSGMALKKHPPGKNVPGAHIPAQVRKASNERSVDSKSISRQVHSKEALSLGPDSVHPKQGQLLHNQKQLQKHQFLKTNNCIKEGGGMKKEPTGMPTDHSKEDEKEKFKLRKLEKSLQPRQRRSSRSLSVDEPPLFIPDNISTLKRESSDHLSPSESKSVWVPSKQCGFCRKPHGNSGASSTPALQHG